MLGQLTNGYASRKTQSNQMCDLLSVQLGQVAQNHAEGFRVVLMNPKVNWLQTAHVEKQLCLLQSHGAAQNTEIRHDSVSMQMTVKVKSSPLTSWCWGGEAKGLTSCHTSSIWMLSEPGWSQWAQRDRASSAGCLFPLVHPSVYAQSYPALPPAGPRTEWPETPNTREEGNCLVSGNTRLE